MAITAGCGTSTTGIPQFTKVAFLSFKRVATPPTSLFTSNLDGSNVTPIPFSTTNVQLLSVSADAKIVTFVSGSDVWTENTDGTGQKNLTNLGNVSWERISPNGKKIVYNTTNHIFVMNVDGSGILDLTPTLPTGTNTCYQGSFSADSAQVVFICQGNGTGIYTVKVDGTGLKTVEVRTNWAQYPAFTPDGKKIIFAGSTGNPYGTLSVNIDGTGETMLIPSADEVMLLNSSLYYVNSCNASTIFKANLDGSNPVKVSDGNGFDDLFYGGGC